MSGSINSPFRYAGGKFYARKLILEHITKHQSYIEPFAGGGSIFFAKTKVEYNQLNDIDNELVNVYQTIRDNPEEIIYLLKKRPESESRIPSEFTKGVLYGDPLPASKELHGFFKNIFAPENNIERSQRWFYLNRTSYSGIMSTQNMYWAMVINILCSQRIGHKTLKEQVKNYKVYISATWILKMS